VGVEVSAAALAIHRQGYLGDSAYFAIRRIIRVLCGETTIRPVIHTGSTFRPKRDREENKCQKAMHEKRS